MDIVYKYRVKTIDGVEYTKFCYLPNGIYKDAIKIFKPTSEYTTEELQKVQEFLDSGAEQNLWKQGAILPAELTGGMI